MTWGDWLPTSLASPGCAFITFAPWCVCVIAVSACVSYIWREAMPRNVANTRSKWRRLCEGKHVRELRWACEGEGGTGERNNSRPVSLPQLLGCQKSILEKRRDAETERGKPELTEGCTTHNKLWQGRRDQQRESSGETGREEWGGGGGD